MNRIERALWQGALGLLAASATLPLLGLVLLALSPRDQPTAGITIPKRLTLENFSRAWSAGSGLGGYIAVSALITALVTAASVICSTLAGYALATMRFPGQRYISAMFLVGLIIPVEGMIVAVFYDMRELHLNGTIWSVVLPQTALMVGFGTFWMRAAFRGLSPALLEAARLDGSSHLRILRTIVVPLARPALLALISLTVVWTWNDLLLSLVLLASTTADLRTAPLALGLFQSQETLDLQGLAAVGVIVGVVPVAIFAMLQRHFVHGITAGAIIE